ncbi:lipopolysaccharide biosynthesis protein [Candidatus Enterococcus ferrettii]|uniref:Polysaccharide biosynthesis protein n=1 Tax=Candidatus Enterococcus ferrettii TaxID=2815324 RepID=A0ABV0ELV9_9ENTE|nr:oligosaccharide flippase family protein [Enterococcus sp. 665A]MBO1341784.1 oligosaccharide flippase family protein [Enterococcus sp. 665A]
MIDQLKIKWRNVPLTVKVSTAYAVSSIIQRCLSFITMPLFTRMLTTEQYGQYTVYSSWSGILTIFITLNLGYGSFSTAMIKFENRREEYISSIEGICLLLSGIFLLMYLPFRGFWNNVFELPTGLIVVMIFELLTSSAILFWSGKKRFEFKYKSVVAVTLLTSFISPCLAYLFVINSDEKGYARILGYAFTTIIIGGFFFGSNLLKGRKFYSKEFWKFALGFNIPLIAYYLSQVIFNQSDRLMINYYSGTSKAAMYGVASNLALILNFILNAINNSYVPWFYKKMKDGKQKDNRVVSSTLAFTISILLLCIIWFAPEIITIMAGKQYGESIGVVAPVAMSLLLLFYSQLFINVEFYFEEKKALVWASIGAALINVVLNAWLIPIFGFIVAGYTTLISYVVFSLSNYFVMKLILKKRNIVESGFDPKELVLIFIVFSASGFLGVTLYEHFIARICISLIVLAILIVFRSLLLDNLKKLREDKN